MGKSNKLKQLGSLPDDLAARGTPLWAFNHFRTQILTSLLNDLVVLENDGMDENHCKLIQQTLGSFVNATTEIPKGGFLTGALSTEAAKFEKLYFEWNGIKGKNNPEALKTRKDKLRDLRASRQKITNKIRNLQTEFFNGLDTAILVSTYRALGDLIVAAPNLFKNLAAALARYQRRGPLTG